MKVTFNGAAIESLRLQAGEDALRPVANRVLNAARRNVKVDKGQLRASLAIEFLREGGRAVARIGSNLDYAIYQEEGTGIYGPRGRPITSSSGKMLRWPVTNNSGSGRRRYSGGQTAAYAYARSVRGTPATHFLRDALDAAR